MLMRPPLVNVNAIKCANWKNGVIVAGVSFRNILHLDQIPWIQFRYFRPFTQRSTGPVFGLLLGLSSRSARPITGQVISVTWPMISWAKSDLFVGKREKTGPGQVFLPQEWSVLQSTCFLFVLLNIFLKHHNGQWNKMGYPRLASLKHFLVHRVMLITLNLGHQSYG